MLRTAEIETYRRVQSVAKSVLAALGPTIGPADTERSLAARATQLLAAAAITQTWYYNCPALVLLGSRSCLSLSGRDYEPADEPVGQHNLVTVDLSPRQDDVWGDCARSFCIESGRATQTPQSPEFREGVAMQRRLHKGLQAYASPDVTFADLHAFADAAIAAQGFENLDFLSNVGHTLVSRLSDRSFITADSPRRLKDAGLFTFEPHVRKRGGTWGFKHEDVYYFDREARLHRL